PLTILTKLSVLSTLMIGFYKGLIETLQQDRLSNELNMRRVLLSNRMKRYNSCPIMSLKGEKTAFIIPTSFRLVIWPKYNNSILTWVGAVWRIQVIMWRSRLMVWVASCLNLSCTIRTCIT